MRDPYQLERFVAAQEHGGSYLHALEELRRGRKTTHWIWWVFPQVSGLGTSDTSSRYALGTLGEARAYLEHPILGARLREALGTLLEHREATIGSIVGGDDVKVRSCATLFAIAQPDEPLFREVLDVFFAGAADPRTDSLLGER